VRSQDNSGSTVTRLQAERIKIMAGFLTAPRDVSLLQNVQTSSGAHPVSYSMHTRGAFPAVR